MTKLLLIGVAGAATLLQIGATSSFSGRVSALPFLPLAIIVTWGVLRGITDVWPALVGVALPLALVSEERLGWYVIALLPVAILLLIPSDNDGGIAHAVLRVGLVAAGSSLAYAVILMLTNREWRSIPPSLPAVTIAAAGTAAIAAAFTVICWPLRRRLPRLYG